MFKHYILKFSVSSSFIVFSACSSISTSFRKSIAGYQIKDGCYALFSIAIFPNCGVSVIIKISVIFVFLQSCVLRDYAFFTNISILNASCLIVSIGSRCKLKMDVMLSFLSLFSLIVVLVSSSKFQKFLCFYSLAY